MTDKHIAISLFVGLISAIFYAYTYSVVSGIIAALSVFASFIIAIMIDFREYKVNNNQEEL